MAYTYPHAGAPPSWGANTQIPPTPPFSPPIAHPTPAVDAAALTAQNQPAYQAPQFAPPPPPPPKQSGGVLKTLNFFSSKPSYQQSTHTGEGCLSNPTSPTFYPTVQTQTTGTTYGVTGGQNYGGGATVVPQQQVYNPPQPQPQPQPHIVGTYHSGQGTVPVSPVYSQPATSFPQQQQNQVPLYQPQSQQQPQQQYHDPQNNNNGVVSPPAYSPAWAEKPQQPQQPQQPFMAGGKIYNPGANSGAGPEKIPLQHPQTWPAEKPQTQGNNNQVNNSSPNLGQTQSPHNQNVNNPGQHPAQQTVYNHSASPVHGANNTSPNPSHNKPPPATKPSQAYPPLAHQNAPDSSAYWATLVSQGKVPLAPKPELRGLFRGIARCINKECSIDSTPTCVLSPAKMSMYYGLSPSYSSRESQFFARSQRAPKALITLYNALSTEYLLIPAPPGDGRLKPHTPALTIAGFEHWLLLNALINPDAEHARISAFLSKPGRVIVDDEGRTVPASGFPRQALPGGPEAWIVGRYRGLLETALGSKSAGDEVSEEEGWRTEVEAWKKKVWEGKGELEESQKELEERDEELEECKEELEGAQEELKGCRSELEKAQEELKKRSTELESMKAALAESVKRADDAVSKLAGFMSAQQQQQQQQQRPNPGMPSYAPYQGAPSQAPQYLQNPQNPPCPPNTQAPQFSHNPLAPQPPRATKTPQNPQNPQQQQQHHPQPGYPIHSNTWSTQSSGATSPQEDPARRMSASSLWGQQGPPPPQGQPQGQGQGQGQGQAPGQNRRISQTYVKAQYQPVRK